MSKHRKDIIVINSSDRFLPMFCPICENILSSFEDINSYRKYNYCSDCQNMSSQEIKKRKKHNAKHRRS